MEFSGQLALVTGGSRGIGLELVNALADRGIEVAFTYRSSAAQAMQHITDDWASKGRWVKGYQVDGSNPEAVRAFIDQLKNEKGLPDYLVNNAGITRDRPLAMMSDEEWTSVMEANLFSAFFYCRALAYDMIRRGSGRIVQMVSVSGETGLPGQVNYSASKAGMIGLTKALANEVARFGVLVNAVSPGYIETDMLDEKKKKAWVKNIPMGRVGTSREVANTVLFLLSDLSSYTTGQIYRVDGGLYT